MPAQPDRSVVWNNHLTSSVTLSPRITTPFEFNLVRTYLRVSRSTSLHRSPPEDITTMPTIPQIPEALIHIATSSRLNSFIAESFLCGMALPVIFKIPAQLELIIRSSPGLYTLLFAQAMCKSLPMPFIRPQVTNISQSQQGICSVRGTNGSIWSYYRRCGSWSYVASPQIGNYSA